MLFDSALDKVRAGTDQPRGRAERHHGRGGLRRSSRDAGIARARRGEDGHGSFLDRPSAASGRRVQGRGEGIRAPNSPMAHDGTIDPIRARAHCSGSRTIQAIHSLALRAH